MSVTLVIQQAKRMRRIMSSLACLALLYFSTWSHKRYDFREKVTEHKIVFWLFVQLLSETFPTPTITQRHITNFTHVFM